MEAVVPWSALCEVIEPHYPKAGSVRPPIGLERMLRIHFIPHWCTLAELACGEALYNSASLRNFVGMDLGRERGPACQGRAGTAGPRIQGQHRQRCDKVERCFNHLN